MSPKFLNVQIVEKRIAWILTYPGVQFAAHLLFSKLSPCVRWLGLIHENFNQFTYAVQFLKIQHKDGSTSCNLVIKLSHQRLTL